MPPFNRQQRRSIFWGVISLIIALIIWVLSSSSNTPGPPLRHPLDWTAHFLTYTTLAFALGRATGRRYLALVIAAWFGALDETHQAFVPGREAGISDWYFDLLGGWVGSYLAQRSLIGLNPAPTASASAILSDPAH